MALPTRLCRGQLGGRYAGAVSHGSGRSCVKTTRRCSSSWGLLGSASRPSPPPRSSHTVTRVGTGKIAVFGGEDEPRHAFDPRVHIFDGDTWTTRCSDASASATPLLLGHGAASVADTLYVFGGRTGGANCADDPTGQVCETETAMLLALDTSSDAGSTTWEVLQIPGGPEARSFHAMTSVEDKVYVFGGCGTSGRLNDLWCLDTGAEGGPSWQCLSLGGSTEGMYPSPRGGAGLVAVPEGDGAHKLILLYGFDGSQRGDVWTFHVDSTAGMWENITDTQSGDIPQDRSVFAATRISESKVFLFGGEVEASTEGHEGAGAFRSDSYVLDTNEMSWRSVDTGAVEDGPIPRGWMEAAVLGEKGSHLHSIVVAGGEELRINGLSICKTVLTSGRLRTLQDLVPETSGWDACGCYLWN